MSEDKQIIVVFGATGAEGTAVVNAFNKLRENGNDSFLIRAVVRSIDAPESQYLQGLVDEMHDILTETNFKRAFTGAYGVYIANDYFVDLDIDREMKQLKRVQDYCISLGIEHVILSCGEDTRPFAGKRRDVLFWKKNAPGGRDPTHICPSYDAKGGAADQFVTTVPTTKLYPAFNLELFLSHMNPIEENGTGYNLSLPVSRNDKIPVVASQDIGSIACAIFQDPSHIGTTVGVKSDELTGVEMAATFSQAFNVSVEFKNVSYEDFGNSGLPGAGAISNMLRFITHDEKYALRRKQPPSLKTLMKSIIIPATFQSWVQDNEAEIGERFFGAAGELAEMAALAGGGKDAYSHDGSIADTKIMNYEVGEGEVEWA